jgi:hypothetical protein
MKRVTSMSIAALVAATIALGAAAPALAQDQGPQGPRGDVAFRMDRDGPRHEARGQQGQGMRGGLLALVCSERGGDRLEHMLLNLTQRTNPTGDQVALYDALKAAAMSAQADFAKACEAARPAGDTAANRDIVDAMKARLDIEVAHVAAMSSVLPAFEAFYDSLSDEQKQALAPRGDDRSGFRTHRMRGPGMDRQAPHSMNR